MKAIFLFLIITGNASAVSLESALSAQTHITISPVTFEDKSIVTSEGVCATLGYIRVVSVTTEPCVPGEVLYTFAGNTSHNVSRFKAHMKCGDDYKTKLSSVTCAK